MLIILESSKTQGFYREPTCRADHQKPRRSTNAYICSNYYIDVPRMFPFH